MLTSAGLQLLLTDLGNVWILLLLLPQVRLSVRRPAEKTGWVNARKWTLETVQETQ